MNYDEVVIATRNTGKYKEFSYLLKNYFQKIKYLRDFDDIPEIEETGSTFSENSFIKASRISKLLNKTVLADDSGLVVDALGGKPGVYSARYAGANSTDEQNVEKLLEEMGNTTNRNARFVCCLTLIIPGGDIIESEGTCEGIITTEPRGDGGFGYDPVFFVPELKKTMSEIPEQKKNSISHRYRAIENMKKILSAY